MVVDTRSAYELQRDDNVQRNNAFLSSIGLGSGLVPPKVVKPKAVPRKEQDLVPSRASSRQSKKVVRFEQLTDDYFKTHEPDSDDEAELRRESTKRARTKATYFKPSTWEGVARSRKVVDRRLTNPIVAAKADPSAPRASVAASVQSSPMFTQVASLGVAPVQVTNDLSVKPYYAAGKKGQCPRCLDWFCIRRDGMLHTHHCRQVAGKAPLAPLLPTV